MCIIHPSLSLNLPHVLSISRNCLAPPHVPESRIAHFIPQCIHSPHLSLYPGEFVFSSCVFIPVAKLPCIPEICLVPVSYSWDLFPVFRSSPASFVNCCFGLFVIPVISICYPSSFSLKSCVFIVIGYMFIWLLGIDSVSCSRWLLSCLVFLYLVLSDYLASDICLCIDYDFCLARNKSLFSSGSSIFSLHYL